jgi:hypothetical protein
MPLPGDYDYVPLTIALAGRLQLSHLHVANRVNVLVHEKGGVLDSAVGYSVGVREEGVRVVIGEALGLRFRVRWLGVDGISEGGCSKGRPVGWYWFATPPAPSLFFFTDDLTCQQSALSTVWRRHLHHLFPQLRVPQTAWAVWPRSAFPRRDWCC